MWSSRFNSTIWLSVKILFFMQTLKSSRIRAVLASFPFTCYHRLQDGFSPFSSSFFLKYIPENWWGIIQWNQFSYTPCSSNQLSSGERIDSQLLHISCCAHGPAVNLLHWPPTLVKFTPLSYSSFTPEDWPRGGRYQSLTLSSNFRYWGSIELFKCTSSSLVPEQ